MRRKSKALLFAVSMIGIGLPICDLSRGAPNQQAIAHSASVSNRAPLLQTPFVRLPLGSVHAEGWLLRQLQLQKAGLTGSAENLYEALTPDSAWLGGNGEAWEKGPYYVRGLIVLAYTLDDAELKLRAKKWVDWVLRSQKADGSFGPASNDDWWPRMVVLFYLRDFYEATGDARVIPFLSNYFHYQLAALPTRHLRDWGRSRAGDNIDVVLWTYNLSGDKSLLDLAKLLYKQAYPWSSIYTDSRFYGFAGDFQPHHIVNVNQALKDPPVGWQFTREDSDRNAFAAGVENMNRRYGRIDGEVSGTEMLSGRSSTAGVELCADVERIISDSIAVTILGDARIGDNMERVAYNSLPAHTSPRMRQITYYQLPNQVAAVIGGHGFTQDYPNGNVPGPYSGFPCCCYNWHSGWPKFVEGMWAATRDGGLALIAYGPNRVSTTMAGGVAVTISQATDYPFKEEIALNVELQKPAAFPLLLRVPSWCDHAEIRVNGDLQPSAKSGTFARIEREWKTGDKVELKFPMVVRASTWINNSVGLERGPLAFALRIHEDWRSIHPYPPNFDECEVRPLSPWNYALQVDRAAPNVTVHTKDVPAVPFDNADAPVTLTVPAKQLPSWGVRELRGRVTLGKANGRWEFLEDAPASLDPNVAHRLRIETKGATIRIFVDNMDRPLFEHDDETFASGGVGLRAYNSAAQFDDVKIDGKLVDDFNHASADRWHPYGGAWSIRDGMYSVDPARDAKTLLDNPSALRDFTFEATVTVAPGGDAGVIFRVTDPSSKLDGYHGYYVGLSTQNGKSQDASEPPVSPVISQEPTENVELIPFGSGKLRISYFPVLSTK